VPTELADGLARVTRYRRTTAGFAPKTWAPRSTGWRIVDSADSRTGERPEGCARRSVGELRGISRDAASPATSRAPRHPLGPSVGRLGRASLAELLKQRPEVGGFIRITTVFGALVRGAGIGGVSPDLHVATELHHAPRWVAATA
jgi:hypothetical protein